MNCPVFKLQIGKQCTSKQIISNIPVTLGSRYFQLCHDLIAGLCKDSHNIIYKYTTVRHNQSKDQFIDMLNTKIDLCKKKWLV